MSYRDWSELDGVEFRGLAYSEIFDNIPSVADLSEDDVMEAEELFTAGWLTFGVYDEEQLYDIRDKFYDLVGLSSEDFDWESYREIYDSI